jgi:hypothetical protein
MEEKEQAEDTILEEQIPFLAQTSDHEPVGTVEEEGRATDYSGFTKKDFVRLLNELLRAADWKHIDATLREVRPLFDELRNRDRHEALERFIAAGGRKEDFEYRQPEADVSFDANYKLLRDRLAEHQRSLENQKQENLYRKQDLLDQLRALVDGEDTEHNFARFKKIQKEWKATGPVPAGQSHTLWASYLALVDRFYDQRSIYFELKDLDRKRNLETKLEICGRAEKLVAHPQLREALSELNELHHEFRNTGPVPIDEKDKLWNRFKAASDAVYARRDAHEKEMQKMFAARAEIKEKLVAEIQPYAQFQSAQMKEWNQKTQEVLAIQKKWEAAGIVPRARTKDLNRQFWQALKTFFQNKRAFFKSVDAARGENLRAKRELIEMVRQLQHSADLDATLSTLKDLQRKWKEIGPVPEKVRRPLFAEFKGLCDSFFQQQRSREEEKNSEEEENLRAKEAICMELERDAGTLAATPNRLAELQEAFLAGGLTPRAKVAALRARFDKAVEAYIAGLPVGEFEKAKMLLHSERAAWKGDTQGMKKLAQREQTLRKKLQKAENDLATLKNNLEFFGRSKNAEVMKEAFSDRMLEAANEVKRLKEQLKLLKSA